MQKGKGATAPYGGKKGTGCGGVKCNQGPKAKLTQGKGGKLKN